MERLRENLNPEEKLHAFGRPTQHKTEVNQQGLHCRECGQLYYIDETSYRKALAGLEGDASEIRFYCEDCEAALAEDFYRR
jgi:hypothetical protein